ncbi:MAG: SRPBCC family protein [Dehalococcoidales bacterium]
MAAIDKELVIKAPPEKIYDFVIKSSNLTRLWPSLMEIKNEKLLPNGGYCTNWKYKMAGVCLKGKAECIEVVPNKWFSVKIGGAVDCTMTWTFRTNDNIHTKVTITLDYRVSLPIFNRLAENIIIKMNERESEVVLDNLREILEMS